MRTKIFKGLIFICIAFLAGWNLRKWGRVKSLRAVRECKVQNQVLILFADYVKESLLFCFFTSLSGVRPKISFSLLSSFMRRCVVFAKRVFSNPAGSNLSTAK